MKLLKQVTNPGAHSSRNSSLDSNEDAKLRNYKLKKKMTREMEPELRAYVKEFRAKVRLSKERTLTSLG